MKKLFIIVFLLLSATAFAQDDYGPIECSYCAGVTAEIRGTQVNVRATSSVSATVITQLNTGDKVTILGYGKSEIIKNVLCPWFSISFTDPKTKTQKEGWVYGAFIYYKTTVEATYANCITGDFTHLIFKKTDNEEIDFYLFQDSTSVLKWADLTITEENYNIIPNPDYLNKKYVLTIEFLPSTRTTYDWDRAIDCREEVLTGVESLR